MRRARLVGLVLLACCSTTGCSTTGSSPPELEDAPPASGDDGYDGGFVLRSDDGSREMVMEGLFQTVLAFNGEDREPSSEFAIKRMRPEFSGRVDNLRFKLEPKFTEHEVELEEAWVGADMLQGDGRLMLGRMKAPFGLEEVRSRRHIDFPAFSLVNQLSPAEDHGIFFNGMGAGGGLEYGLALYNGTGASDTNSSKDVAARIMAHPFHGDEGSAWHNLQLGLAATIGEQDASTGDVNLKNEAGQPVVRFAPDSALDGSRTRLGLEGAWFSGPWFAQAELMTMRQDMSAGGGSPGEVAFSGGYLTLSRSLTGEDKSFGGVTPGSPFDSFSGTGRGAWVLALRLSQLDVEDDLVGLGLAAAGESTDRMRSTSLGLNWVPNRHAIVRHALIWSQYGDPVDLGKATDDEELAFVIEFQLHF